MLLDSCRAERMCLGVLSGRPQMPSRCGTGVAKGRAKYDEEAGRYTYIPRRSDADRSNIPVTQRLGCPVTTLLPSSYKARIET
jgi:hypothetical protein